MADVNSLMNAMGAARPSPDSQVDPVTSLLGSLNDGPQQSFASAGKQLQGSMGQSHAFPVNPRAFGGIVK